MVRVEGMRLCSIVVFLSTSLVTGAISRSGCLCTSNQPCWPSAATFRRLESELSRPLVYPRPSASACYPSLHPSGNCTDIKANWTNGFWRAAHPGSMEMPNWETLIFPNKTIDACYLNTTITTKCEQGNIPAIGVDARSVADVKAAIGFAMEHSLKLVVKNTGHDFVGRSTAPGAFQVWMHNMKNITYNATFAPRGAPPDETYEALTLDAGVQWKEAYAAASKHGRMMVGGVSAGSVGAAGGWLAGGGYSFLSPSYGLGVDNVLEISIILSTGECLVTNAYLNSDLFWALRGGGGGTYGIVTSVTYRTYPAVPIQLWFYQGNVTNSSVLPELVEGLLRHQIQFTDDGWGGYSGVSAQEIHFVYFAPNMTNETVVTTTEGWRNFTQSLEPYGVTSTAAYASLSWDYLMEQIGTNSDNLTTGALSLLLTSRLLTRNTIAKNASKLAELFIKRQSGFNTIAGGRVSQHEPDSAGLHPEWRNAIVHAPYAVGWVEETPFEEIQEQIQRLEEQTRALSHLAPNDASYLNEASPYERDWKKTFFGSHYPALKSIKDKYDPYRLFAVREGVGSDDWNKNLTCRY